jgi:hypothetical protein
MARLAEAGELSQGDGELSHKARVNGHLAEAGEAGADEGEAHAVEHEAARRPPCAPRPEARAERVRSFPAKDSIVR